MAIALEPGNKFELLAGNILQRPNGERVSRLLREALGLDARWLGGVRKMGWYPVGVAVLGAAGVLLALLSGQLSAARGKAALDLASEATTAMQPTILESAYQAWIWQAHAQAAAQGDDTPVAENF